MSSPSPIFFWASRLRLQNGTLKVPSGALSAYQNRPGVIKNGMHPRCRQEGGPQPFLPAFENTTTPFCDALVTESGKLGQ
jgi:hypothetical protein